MTQTQTREIPRIEWNDFFSRFSDQHDDDAVEVEMIGSEIGAQIEGRELHLRGISPAQNVREPDLALSALDLRMIQERDKQNSIRLTGNI